MTSYTLKTNHLVYLNLLHFTFYFHLIVDGLKTKNYIQSVSLLLLSLTHRFRNSVLIKFFKISHNWFAFGKVHQKCVVTEVYHFGTFEYLNCVS